MDGPVSINLDLTLACDYRCAHCIDAALLNGGRHLQLVTALATLDVLSKRGLRSVILIGGGEPTLHPFFEEVVTAVKKLGLECAIASNGSHNGRIASVAPLLGPKDWVRLSLDAGTEPTFQALHRPRKPITLEHICSTAAGLKMQAPQVQLGYSFVVMWSSPGQAQRPVVTNVHEMAGAAALAKRYGFDYISFKPMLVRNASRAEVVNAGEPGRNPADLAAIDEIRACLGDALCVADARFRVVPSSNLVALLEEPGLERRVSQPGECHMQQFRQVITPDGVVACPAHRGNRSSLLADQAGYATPEAFRETVRATATQIQSFNAAVECDGVTCIYQEANWWLEHLIVSGQPVTPLAARDFFL
ncbi:MAG: radical SAM protein [Acidobacteria bacterium]|nr:radical SAM protein [Acidobacteriota bacterium]